PGHRGAGGRSGDRRRPGGGDRRARQRGKRGADRELRGGGGEGGGEDSARRRLPGAQLSLRLARVGGRGLAPAARGGGPARAAGGERSDGVRGDRGGGA